jgi:hypothetical protein
MDKLLRMWKNVHLSEGELIYGLTIKNRERQRPFRGKLLIYGLTTKNSYIQRPLRGRLFMYRLTIKNRKYRDLSEGRRNIWINYQNKERQRPLRGKN